MLSDEEKKAIERLKNFIYTYQDVIEDEYSDYEEKESAKEYQEVSEKILSLIKKQQKEIEELKEKNRQSKMRIVQLENEITARIEDVNQYYTPNDKIKAKIEELEKELEDIQLKNINKDEISRTDFYFIEKLRNKIDVLQSLLEKE